MGDKVTARELEVVRTMLYRQHYLDVALELDISYQTVKNHVSNLFRKTGATNQAQLVWRLRHQLEPEEKGANI